MPTCRVHKGLSLYAYAYLAMIQFDVSRSSPLCGSPPPTSLYECLW